jgi:FkbM family methyltransferase
MKQVILGTSLGRSALKLREKIVLVKAALFEPEIVGTLANDQLSTYFITKLCKPNMIFIDVGSHIGSIISEVMHSDDTVKVIGVEAIPQKVKKLKQKFPNVEIHCCAVGASAGNVSFYINKKHSGYSSLLNPSETTSESIIVITVPIMTLDSLVPPHNVDAIKIDVEGAELGVLRGSKDILKSCRPTIMFESGPQAGTGVANDKNDIYGFLSEFGYQILLPNRLAHIDDGMSEIEFIRSHYYPRNTTNYFAVHSERRNEIRLRAGALLGRI